MADAPGEQEVLQALLHDTRAVLLDFDGPVTALFGGASTAPAARRIKDAVRRIWGSLDADVEECDDSHGLLRRLRDMYDRPCPAPRSDTALKLAEAMVTRYEYEAVASARPTPLLADLVRALRGLGLPLVIVSNNADGPVREFLGRPGLPARFETVVGRDPRELRHLKPDPYPVDLAVRRLALPPSSCLLVGDQLTDLEAARSAGVRFLGFTHEEDRAARMRRHGADWVISSYAPLIDAARTCAATD
ncbi:hydrolase [Streptomyces fumigatiscleroticus]|nr:hydrolase [Streptomyces fumigatiscleroticus]